MSILFAATGLVTNSLYPQWHMRVLFVFVAAYIRRDLPSLLLGCSVATRHLPPLRQGNFAKFTVGGVAQFPNVGRGLNVVVLSSSGVVEDTKTSALMA